MNTNLHEYYLEPQNTRNCTEGILEYSLCIHCYPWLKDNSAALAANDEYRMMNDELKNSSELGRAIELATGVNHGK